ncbi:hypothetical protein [Parasitella parasitica]|uniref:Ndc10 domain-containing protein n=1 Tax=Parasitella parasitica TaxID=35722 RepID=A0A0B7NJG1_9FUNG|nr:hypothetical protein [Parasitella parasitica]
MQKEFPAWCDRTFEAEDPARHTVNESKVVYYIGNKFCKRKKLRLKRGEDPYATLSVNTIEIHLAAIVGLWRDQRNRGINNFPHPRIECEQFMVDTLARKESKKKRNEYHHDRAALTIGDGYTTAEELTALFADYIKRNCEGGLCDALICLFSRYMYIRFAFARQGELVDL